VRILGGDAEQLNHFIGLGYVVSHFVGHLVSPGGRRALRTAGGADLGR
jgi:hypothetical protein